MKKETKKERTDLAAPFFVCSLRQPPHITVRCECGTKEEEKIVSRMKNVELAGKKKQQTCNQKHAPLHKQFVRSLHIPISFIQEMSQ